MPRDRTRGTRRTLSVSLYEDERKHVDAAAKADDIAPATWGAQVIRSALGGGPELSAHAVEALSRSNTELAAVGRALEQIARRIPDARLRDAVTPELIAAVTNRIGQHVRTTDDLMAASIERWPLPERESANAA